MSAAPINDGGPAFPVPGLLGLPNGDLIEPTAGMTLRDAFAKDALVGILGGVATWRDHDFVPRNGRDIVENNALLAYQYADAMIKARQA